MKLPLSLTTNERLFLRAYESSYSIFCKNRQLDVNYESAKEFLQNKSHKFGAFERRMIERANVYKERIKFNEYLDKLPYGDRFKLKEFEEVAELFKLYALKQRWERTDLKLEKAEVDLFRALFQSVRLHSIWYERNPHWFPVKREDKLSTFKSEIDSLQETITVRYANSTPLTLPMLHDIAEYAYHKVSWRYDIDYLIGEPFKKISLYEKQIYSTLRE